MKRMLLRFAALILLLVGYTGTAQADGLSNGGFETGDFKGWQSVGTSSIETKGSFGIAPTQGNFQALLTNHPSGDFGRPIADLEASLGLAAGTLRELGDGRATVGTAVWETFHGNAGDTISFDWNFLTNADPDDPFANDLAFVLIDRDGVTQNMFSFADTARTDAPPPTSAFTSMSGYQIFSYQLPHPGTYRLAVGIVDVGDDLVTSGVLIDNVSVVEKTTKESEGR